jgi:hypothetical protein
MQVVAGVAAAHGLSADTIAAIIAKTDGVPLFVEELTRSVMESAGEDCAVPATLKDSLMARLDRLGGAREVAQIAAVIGRQFTFSLLEAAAGKDTGELEGMLAKLVAAGIMFPEERGLASQGGTKSDRADTTASSRARPMLSVNRVIISSVVASIQCASSSTISTGSLSPIRTMISTISASVDALRCAGGGAEGAVLASGIDNSSANTGSAIGSAMPRAARRAQSFSARASGASAGAKPAARLRYWITG